LPPSQATAAAGERRMPATTAAALKIAFNIPRPLNNSLAATLAVALLHNSMSARDA
jgi:hypothetical protein